MPASTIVMPAPPYSCGTNSPVVPRSASPRHTASVRSGRIVEQRPDMLGIDCLFGEEAPHGVAQRHLLVGEFEVHFRGNPSTRCAVMFLLICVVPPAMVSERDVRR